MSYSGGAAPRRSDVLQQPLNATGRASLASVSRPSRSSQSLRAPHQGDSRGNEPATSSYALECRKIQDAAQHIQQLAADVRKETSQLATPSSGSRGQGGGRVAELEQRAQSTKEEAGRVLQGLPNMASTSEETKMCRLMQPKFRENIDEAMRSFEAAMSAYRTAQAHAPSHSSSSGAGASGGAGTAGTAGRTVSPNFAAFGAVELETRRGNGNNLGVALLPLQMQNMQSGVTDADVDVHTDIVQGMTEEIMTIEQDIRGLQRAMVDIAEHATTQGEALTTIEQNMDQAVVSTASATEAVVQASRTQRGNMKQVACMLFAAVLIVLGVLIYAIN
eukprot:NODE_8012_length_1530_cov_10.089808.p1 GENE.NODE_8012_length_1530_cov_10.089808~~NODE_8012_length_1530_cov_10.089808.p1  ORF type:complete len:333 (-),score=64.37 NODE_8012_length_1530_cov_10.089808:294-1292(-)